MSNEHSLTVSELNEKFAERIKSDGSFANISIKGEISNFTNHYKTGHLYFTLKDEKSSVGAVMFKWSAKSLRFVPEDGMKVVAVGDAAIYEPRGHCQLKITQMNPEGMGELYLRFLELRDKLELEGLFAQKRPLPKAPETIAVITAETGAALQDVLNILSRRNPLIKVVLIPALVQGVNAPQSLIGAVKTAQTTGADLLIIGRGGGSLEDLWGFNDEALARELFASKIPTISAVGHEVDFTIADFVADLRAPTPSAAAELAVSDIGEVYGALSALQSELRHKANRAVSLSGERIDALGRELYAKSPKAKLETYGERLGVFEKQIGGAMHGQIEGKRQSLVAQMKAIDALSPLKVLTRGYSIVSDAAGKSVIDAAGLKVGDSVSVRLHKGKVKAKVEEIHD
ncbi:MAG: exodeoxyribonuclease VII large subunit [Oscillospiraceae bacterium]|nr:exodeoxyribonuclease VII large subunit [Oscillospiraceae bacterium]